MMRRLVVAAFVLTMLAPAGNAGPLQPAAKGSVYVAYYWRAKPRQLDAYSEYIRTVAVPIDEDARRSGAFEEVHTVVPAPGSSADWTHLRIFRLRDGDAARALSAALDAATTRVVPDEAKRKANSERALTLRDFVRQETWEELK